MIALSNADLSLKFRAVDMSVCAVAHQWFGPIQTAAGALQTGLRARRFRDLTAQFFRITRNCTKASGAQTAGLFQCEPGAVRWRAEIRE